MAGDTSLSSILTRDKWARTQWLESMPVPELLASDAQLIAQVVRRDQAAFAALYDRHASAALGLAVRILGERAIGEEIVQEGFWRVWKKAATYDKNRTSFRTWLLSIIHHLAVDELRRRRGQPPMFVLEEDDDLLDEIPDGAPDPYERAWSNLRSEEVRSALNQLPEAQRTVVELAYFQGMTHREIAEQLNEPPGTIFTRARLALSKLKELLKESKVIEK